MDNISTSSYETAQGTIFLKNQNRPKFIDITVPLIPPPPVSRSEVVVISSNPGDETSADEWRSYALPLSIWASMFGCVGFSVPALLLAAKPDADQRIYKLSIRLSVAAILFGFAVIVFLYASYKTN